MPDITTVTYFSYQIFILLTVILSKVIVSHYINHEPLRFFQFYCQKLSHKVNKPQNSKKQQSIAGLLAILVTLTPITVILWMFESFVDVDFLWQSLLLYTAMGSFGLTQINKDIAQALTVKQNHLAKQTLSEWVLRETDVLSSLGICKTSIEMKLLRTLQQGFTVAIIFILFGPLIALVYRLLLEMHYCWNTKLIIYRYFGLYSRNLINIVSWLPTRIFTLILLMLSIGKNVKLYWNLISKYFFKLNNSVALLLLALTLEIKLGGVVMYDDNINPKEKIRRPDLNDLARQPEITDLLQANNKIKAVITISLVLAISLAIAIEFINVNI